MAGHIDNVKLLLRHGADVNLEYENMASYEVGKVTVLDTLMNILKSQEGDTNPFNKRYRDLAGGCVGDAWGQALRGFGQG